MTQIHTLRADLKAHHANTRILLMRAAAIGWLLGAMLTVYTVGGI